jgi:hypothetical protein
MWRKSTVFRQTFQAATQFKPRANQPMSPIGDTLMNAGTIPALANNSRSRGDPAACEP